ncbi:MAG TPA: alpha/beta fold hydrolase [Acidimicrobiia bacterium]|nr:alpha/beta fold hydrolase [Acidimicrobiia bacterium]
MSRTVVYLPGMGGNVGISPALAQLDLDVVIPAVPGFTGESGFEAPTDYLGWLVATWDAIDASGAIDDGPVPVIGASVGGMLAAELAALRPEVVSKLALLAPFGIADVDQLGFDYFSLRGPDRLPHLFAKGVPEMFEQRFLDRGEDEAPVASYIVDIATAALTWPIGDRGTAKRLHRIRCPRLVLMGGQDELVPPELAEAWGGATVIDGAGHLLEWDCPDQVAVELGRFLPS